MRHRQYEVAAASVLETCQLGPHVLPAATLLPQVGRLHDRHDDLLAADRVHLLAQDAFDSVLYACAKREQRKDAGGNRLHVGAAQEKPVPGKLHVRGCLPQRFTQ